MAQSDVSDVPFLHLYPDVEPPPKPESEQLSPLQSNASNAASTMLALPPIASYPSKQALFEAIQGWAKLRGYAFSISRSTRLNSQRQKVTYSCDRWPAVRQLVQGIRNTQSRGTGCPFSIIAVETSLGWEVRYRPGERFSVHNHPPSQSLVAHPSHRQLSIESQNTAQNLFLAGKVEVIRPFN
jgi:hypothetical protein